MPSLPDRDYLHELPDDQAEEERQRRKKLRDSKKEAQDSGSAKPKDNLNLYKKQLKKGKK